MIVLEGRAFDEFGVGPPVEPFVGFGMSINE